MTKSLALYIPFSIFVKDSQHIDPGQEHSQGMSNTALQHEHLIVDKAGLSIIEEALAQ